MVRYVQDISTLMACVGFIFNVIYKFKANIFSGMLTWYYITKTMFHRALLAQGCKWKNNKI